MWRLDPVLGALVEIPRIIRLLPPLGALSIRDQAVRGHVAATRAIRHWQPTEDLPALVAGAGVAGVCAALTLARLGHRVVLIDREPLPFMRQLQSRGRWIDPYFYDWPSCSYLESEFPAVEGVPLRYCSGMAESTAAVWYEELFTKRDVQPLGSLDELSLPGSHLKWSPLTQLARKGVRPSVDDGAVNVELERLHADGRVQASRWLSCSILIVATGFAETLRINDASRYSSPPYWHGAVDYRLFQEDRRSRKTASRVLIAGGADGAIQDLLRLMTGLDDHRELLKKIEDCCGAAALEDVRRSLVVHDQSFWRGYAWVASRDDDESCYHSVLDGLHRQAAGSLLADAARRAKWLAAVRGWRKARGWGSLHSFVRGHHLEPLFGFNRFVTWLLLELGDDLRGLDVDVRFGHELTKIDEAGDHRLRVEFSKECSGVVEPGEDTYDHVLLRFGVRADSALDSASARRFAASRNLLPPHYVPMR